MLVVMQSNATEEQVRAVCGVIESLGYSAPDSRGGTHRDRHHGKLAATSDLTALESMPGVVECIPVIKPYKLVSRDVKPEIRRPRSHALATSLFGGQAVGMVAGRARSRSREQASRWPNDPQAAGARLFGRRVQAENVSVQFQGLGEKGLKILAEVRKEFGMGVVTEAVDNESLDLVEKYADVIQIGARNMQNSRYSNAPGKAEASAAEAGNVRHARRTADRRGIHYVRRKLQRDLVRARRADLFRSHAQHAGPEHHARRPAAEPFADRGGPFAWNRTPQQSAAALARVGGSGRRRNWSKCTTIPTMRCPTGRNRFSRTNYDRLCWRGESNRGGGGAHAQLICLDRGPRGFRCVHRARVIQFPFRSARPILPCQR